MRPVPRPAARPARAAAVCGRGREQGEGDMSFHTKQGNKITQQAGSTFQPPHLHRLHAGQGRGALGGGGHALACTREGRGSRGSIVHCEQEGQQVGADAARD